MTPQMKIGHVEMVSVEWLMQNLMVSVDGFTIEDDCYNNIGINYEWMLREKTKDRSFPYLLATVEENGFRVPICVQPELMQLGNGHHRLSLAILTVIDEIPVYWSDSSDYMASHTTDTEELNGDAIPYFDIMELATF